MLLGSLGSSEIPPLPPALRDPLAALGTAARTHLELLRRILAARHTAARPGSRAYHNACTAAAAVAACPRPDLSGALQALVDRFDTARFAELADWPAAATGALFAELEHLRRIVDLLPALDAQLVRMCLADAEDVRAASPAIAAQPAATPA